MSPPRRRGAGGIVAVVIAVIVGLGVNCSGFREDEIECEQALVHLRECCPGFSPKQVDCNYSERLDCSDSVTARELPAYSVSDSHCLQAKRCADLVKSGDCERAQKAKLRVVEVEAGARPNTQEPVCAP